MTFADISTVVVTVAALATIADFGYRLIKDRSAGRDVASVSARYDRRLLISACLVIAAWGAAGFDWYSRHFATTAYNDAILDWGNEPPDVFYMTANTARLADFSATDRMMLLVRIGYTNIDKMTDTKIEKSIPFTINGEVIRMSLAGTNNLRLMPKVDLWVEYDLILLPNQFEADKVSSLSDVQKLGGVIIGSRGTTTPFRVIRPPSQ
jgi:hypothetical protein